MRPRPLPPEAVVAFIATIFNWLLVVTGIDANWPTSLMLRIPPVYYLHWGRGAAAPLGTVDVAWSHNNKSHRVLSSVLPSLLNSRLSALIAMTYELLAFSTQMPERVCPMIRDTRRLKNIEACFNRPLSYSLSLSRFWFSPPRGQRK